MRWPARCSPPSPSRRCWPRSCCPNMSRKPRRIVVRALRRLYDAGAALVAWQPQVARGRHRRRASSAVTGFLAHAARQRIPAGAGGRQFLDPRLDAADHVAGAGDAATRKMREILLRHPEVITVVSQHGRPDDGSDASPFSNVELFVPLKPFDEWPHGSDQGQADRAAAAGVRRASCRASASISRNTFRTTSRRRISGVKGANSVKIVGPNLDVLEQLGRPGHGRDGAGPRRRRSRHLPGARASPT